MIGKLVMLTVFGTVLFGADSFACDINACKKLVRDMHFKVSKITMGISSPEDEKLANEYLALRTDCSCFLSNPQADPMYASNESDLKQRLAVYKDQQKDKADTQARDAKHEQEIAANKQAAADANSKEAAGNEQATQEALSGGASTMHYYYKSPNCLDDKTWQFANVKAPKQLLADKRCKVEKQTFMADKGKLTIVCGKADKYEFFADNARCERHHKGKFR